MRLIRGSDSDLIHPHMVAWIVTISVKSLREYLIHPTDAMTSWGLPGEQKRPL
jgi:hypothetical protein